MQNVVLVKELLTELLKTMEIAVDSLEVNEDDMGIIRADLTVDDDEAALLIGAYGQTLTALQSIVKSLLWKKGLEEKSTVQLDINHYRRKQEERMIEIAQEKAEAVRGANIPQFMPPMSPYMRRLIHLFFTKEEYSDLETESVGEEGKRRIQIRKRGSSNSDLEV